MIRWANVLRIMLLRIDESQGKMTARSAVQFRRLRIPISLALTLAFAAGLFASAARAQESAQQNQNVQQNPFRSLTDAIGLTTESGQGADFVRQSRPDLDKMDYSKLAGPEKKRAPVRTPAEIEADKAELVAEREKANARLKSLNGEKMAPVAPNKAPPPSDEHF
jgi:hypothetical protein